MCYTAVNYLPIIEEEPTSKKHHETSVPDNGDGGEGGEEDTKKTQEVLVHFEGPSCITGVAAAHDFRRFQQNIYIPPLPERSTPPPRHTA